ncbi:MAG: hypothetical protein HUJ25_14675 [Crocinitomicaceae bacterium]|nr:hypothetical protein [Crocinitomicaceae bacterium]
MMQFSDFTRHYFSCRGLHVITGLLLSAVLLGSCSSNESSDAEDQTTLESNATDSLETDTLSVTDIVDAPNDERVSTGTVILTTGEFHGDEVMEDAEEREWWGVFRSDSVTYLSKTFITCERVNDPILDEGNEQTGWAVSTNNEDETVVLINGQDILSEGEIEEVKLESSYLNIDDELEFVYKNNRYKVYTEGREEKLTDNYSEIRDFKVFVEAKIDGELRSTKVMDVEYLESLTPILLFVGDIDRDGIADLLINASYHYNVYLPTLYLSGEAEGDELLKFTAEHHTVGC